MTAAEAGATVPADGVDLVHEDDAGRGLLRLLEEVAHAGRADADEHLDEVGARDREERDAGLPATARASSVLPVPGGPYRSTPFGIRAPSAWNFFGFSRNSLISWSSSTASSAPATSLNVTFGESGDTLFARLLPKLITFDPPPCIWFMRKIQNPIRRTNGRKLMSSDHQADDPVPFESNLTFCLSSRFWNCGRRLLRRVVHLDLAALDEGGGDLLPRRVEDNVVDRPLLDLRDELRVRHLPLLGAARQQRLARQIHEQDDDDDREEGSSEPVHVSARSLTPLHSCFPSESPQKGSALTVADDDRPAPGVEEAQAICSETARAGSCWRLLRLTHVRQQGHLARPFDRDRDLRLVSPAGAGVAATANLAPVGDEAA